MKVCKKWNFIFCLNKNKITCNFLDSQTYYKNNQEKNFDFSNDNSKLLKQ